MKGKIFIITLVLSILGLVSFSTFAREESPAIEIQGSWMLDRVYENASQEDMFILEPSEAAAVYAESDNVYTINSDGTVDLTITGGGEIQFEKAELVYKDEYYEIVQNDTTVLDFRSDTESGELYRSWKSDIPDASYHDLKFVYTRIPVGKWKLDQVYSGKPGSEQILLDPEEAGSLYSESSNIYTIGADYTTSETNFETGEEVSKRIGVWKKADQNYVTEIDGFEMMFAYDTENDILHRYWTSTQTDDFYQDLDFVYIRADQ